MQAVLVLLPSFKVPKGLITAQLLQVVCSIRLPVNMACANLQCCLVAECLLLFSFFGAVQAR